MSEIVADEKGSDIRPACRNAEHIRVAVVRGIGRSIVGNVGRQGLDVHSPKDDKDQ